MKTAIIISLLCELLAVGPTAVSACLTEADIHDPRGDGLLLNRRQEGEEPSNLTNEGTIRVGTGDRFDNGTILPVGIGSSSPANITTVYNVVEIQSASRALVREYGLDYFETPFKTYENATVFGFKVPSAANASFSVIIQTGIHARERGGPDHLLNFLADLLWAERQGKGLIYGGMEYTAAEVRRARSVGVVVLPLVNPDGVAYDHATDSCWRKNRNQASALPNDTNSVGIDLNRNFPPAWDNAKAMAPNTTDDAISADPSSILFKGTEPLSEPESKNIVWTMDQMPDLRWFLDVHSMAGVMLYGWGHETNQGKDKSMNLLNPAYDGKRGAIPNNRALGYVYSEYYDQHEYDASTLTAAGMVDAMVASGGRQYYAQQSAGLYPAPGAASDHAMYRSLLDPVTKWANGFTLEFGAANFDARCLFYPTVESHLLSTVETGAAFMEFLLNVAKFS